MSQHTQTFTHTVSKGTRYNQIYVPRDMESQFEAGDLVEVRLVRKKEFLYYSPQLKKLNSFKEQLIQQLFKSLLIYPEVQQIFIIGSFLTKNTGYNDIDIILIIEKENPSLEKKISNMLAEVFTLKFHIITTEKRDVENGLQISPVSRSMFYHYVSNKPFEVSKEYIMNKNHLKFLLMFPEDLLEIDLDENKPYYDALRKLICIEHFLKKKEIAPEKMDAEIKKEIGEKQLQMLKTQGHILPILKNSVKKIIKSKLHSIKKIMNKDHE